ncbi:hypothetical protein D8B46_03165 [Candidatus Gracilibacteria bacterium]|nr:MAG: hypothetical protein D8B46_03165 [Candidatus Gracilibacteria bacterium]
MFKKIILIFTYLLITGTLVLAEEENGPCGIVMDKGGEPVISSEFKTCKKGDYIPQHPNDMFKNNGNTAYFIHNRQNNKFTIKSVLNEKIINEVIYNGNLQITGNWSNMYISKYGNHLITVVNIGEGHDEEKGGNRNDLKELEKINGIYFDGVKLLNIDKDGFELIKLIIDGPFDIKIKYGRIIHIELEGKSFYGFDLSDLPQNDYEYLKKTFKLLGQEYDFKTDEKSYFLEKSEREKIDKIINNFVQNKQNIDKIDLAIKLLKEKQKGVPKDNAYFEKINYLIGELKAFQIKNK